MACLLIDYSNWIRLLFLNDTHNHISGFFLCFSVKSHCLHGCIFDYSSGLNICINSNYVHENPVAESTHISP